MKFHEDIIFKNHGLRGGELILRIMNLKGRIVEVHETEFSIIDPKMYKPDFVLEMADKIYIIEFQSTYVDINDKKRFRFYTALIDHIKNKSNKDIEVHVLSLSKKKKQNSIKSVMRPYFQYIFILSNPLMVMKSLTLFLIKYIIINCWMMMS